MRIVMCGHVFMCVHSDTWVEEEIGHDEGEDVRGGVGQHSALVRSWQDV